MVFAKALQKAITQQGKDSDIPIPAQNDGNDWEPTDPEQVPMMYRAQVQGRCSLQYANNNQDLNRWTEEWIYPDPQQEQTPYYQYAEPKLGLDGLVYRLKHKFPFRVFTNCGQDSILRPTISKNGIPFIPGSSIKGLFERLSHDPHKSEELRQKVREYCGSPEQQGVLRFHGAYPVGDWAGTKTVKPAGQAANRYRIVDVVHPQQKRQIQHEGFPQAIAIISFYQPTFIFELSSIKPLPEDEWKSIARWLEQALRPGLGGKTSTGYGLCFQPQNSYPLDISLKGKGVSPLLRSDEPEFRPNLFKASLKGHALRLLAGVSGNQKNVQHKVDHLFGHTTEPGVLQLYWESKPLGLDYDKYGQEKTPIYKTEGKLHIDAPKSDLPFVQKVIEFAFNMGGFGKSWRRVWHGDFFPSYQTRAIGCHWECNYNFSNFEPTVIKNQNDLKAFLTELRTATMNYLGVKTNSTQCLSWKEAWCPERLSVYSQVVSQSKAIKLFHDDKFKTTPAIGGRSPNDTRPTSISFVWHRMLPLGGNQYLEIITLFHGGESRNNADSWQRRMSKDDPGENQLPSFTQKLNDLGFELNWGTKHPI